MVKDEYMRIFKDYSRPKKSTYVQTWLNLKCQWFLRCTIIFMLPREKIMNYKIPMTMRSMLIFRGVKIQKIVLRSIKHSNLSVIQI